MILAVLRGNIQQLKGLHFRSTTAWVPDLQKDRRKISGLAPNRAKKKEVDVC
jgi:hypothetical protein